MEMADDILASMGVSEVTPLSESKQEPVHAVGKSYEEELPEVSDDQRLQFMQESMNTISETKEKTEPSDKGTKRQKAARKASKALDSAARSNKTMRDPYSDLSNARKAALAKSGHMKTWRTNREKSQGNTNPSNPRNKISPALMSVSEPHQKIKSGARWKKGKTRFEAVSYIDNTGNKPTVSKEEVKKMRPLNIKKKKKEPKVKEEGLNKDINPMVATALQEMTAIGSLGVNMAGGSPDPEKPYGMKKKTKKKKSKKNKTLGKFIMNAFTK